MQTENKFLEDLVKMVNGAAGTFAGMGREAEAAFKERAKAWMGGLDFVSRDEFDAVKAMAAAAREDVAALSARIAALEARGAGASASSAAAAASTSAPGVTFPD